MTLFISTQKVGTIRKDSYVTVTGVDGGTYEIKDLSNARKENIAKDKFQSCFERIM